MGEKDTTLLRAALCGAGGISDLTLDAARRSDDFRVVAIQDPDPRALEAVGQRHGIDERFESFEELRDGTADRLDFVIINSPNHVHREQAEAFLRRGVPCLVQKPMAPTARDARAMVELADELGVPLGVTMFEHSKPLHHQLRQIVQGGWLGEPTLLQALSAHDLYLKRPPAEDNWRRDPAKVGGGAFIQLALHQINLARWILGREARAVTMFGARGHTVFEDESDAAAVLFENGPVAHFAAGYAASANHFLIAGTRGTLEVTSRHLLVRGENPYRGPVFAYDAVPDERVFSLAELDEATSVEWLDRCEVHGRFARWIRDGESFPCSGASALRDLEIVDAAYRSKAEGRSISL